MGTKEFCIKQHGADDHLIESYMIDGGLAGMIGDC
jgi:hypothetical protein